MTRNLTRFAVDYTSGASRLSKNLSALISMFRYGSGYQEVIIDEIWSQLGARLITTDPRKRYQGLRLLAFVLPIQGAFEASWTKAGLGQAEVIFGELGRSLVDDLVLPRVTRPASVDDEPPWKTIVMYFLDNLQYMSLDEAATLGLASTLFCGAEIMSFVDGALNTASLEKLTGLAGAFQAYIICRFTQLPYTVPELPVPDTFKSVLREWATRDIDFVYFRGERAED